MFENLCLGSWRLELVFWVLFVNWDLDLGTCPELDSGLELHFFAYGEKG